MKNLYYKIPLIAGLLSLLSVNAVAQFNFGTANSNWSGTEGLYLNPAVIADSRERFTIDIIGANAGVDNNLGSLKSGIINTINNNGNTNNIFDYSGSNTFSVMAPYAKVSGPGCMISINHKHSIALTTAIRGMNQFNNFDRSLYETITNTAYLPSTSTSYTSHNFNYTAQIWSEVGISYGGVILERAHHEVRVGATLRYLGGIGYVGLKGKNLNVQYRENNDTVYAYNSDIEYASNLFGAKSALLNGFGNNNLLNQFFGQKDGGGVGADFGVMYDYISDERREVYEMDGEPSRVDRSKTLYKLRVSASVLDLGAITYKANNNANLEATGNGYLTGTGLYNNAGNFTDFKNYLLAQGFNGDTASKNTRVGIPTRLLFSADYSIYRRFYVNAAYVVNIANRQNFGNTYYNQVTVTPRYDTRLISVGLPITYSMLSKTMKVGVGFRISGFFAGSDDLLGLVAGHQYGANVYVGGSVPFYKLRLHDRDGDHISDRKDMCPDEPGDWENHGCPFKSKDGMNDKDDNKEKSNDDKTEN